MPPEFTPEARAFRESSLTELLADLCRYGHEKGMRNALCLIPTDLTAHGFPEPEKRLRDALDKRGVETKPGAIEAIMHIGVADFDAAAAIPDLDILGCDPYWYIFRAEPEQFMRVYSEQARAAAAKRGHGLQLWLQAFSVPEGREEELRIGVRVAEELGATHLAAWSYAATASMSHIRCARPEVVWSILGEEFGRLRSKN